MADAGTPHAIVTDIEGTTTPITFVKDVLFPYARSRLAAFIAERRGAAGVDSALAAVAQSAGCRPDDDARLVEVLCAWIDADSKATPLKDLQGMIWAAGYADGTLRAPVYRDAATELRRWRTRGHALYVYSSGSVRAQQLLFGHTDQGDLLPLFSGHFDTTIGAKRDAGAYRNIAAAIGRAGAGILFLSDVVAELDAARAAGLATCWIVRPDDVTPSAADLAANTHPLARDFAEVAV